MKLISKLMVNGEHVGYLSDNDGEAFPLIKKLLYTNLYFHTVLDSGYKFYSYDPDTIEDAAGNLIVNLPEVEATEEQKEWLSLQEEQAITDILPDSVCSAYYSYKSQSAIEFKKEASYEINTREELENYLTYQDEFYKQNLYFMDVRPLNSFVHPDALYSLDDIVTKSNVKYYFNIIAKRHGFNNFKVYKGVIDYLMSKGVLDTPNPTPMEFLQAYYAWGIDGVKDTCVERKIKENVNVSFTRTNEVVVARDLYENRIQKPCLVDSKQYLYSGRIKEDIAEVIEFKDETIVTPTSGDLLLLKRFDTRGFDFSIVDCWVSRPEDRMYMKFYTEEGYMYSIKVSLDNFAIFSGDSVSYLEQNFAFNSIVPTIKFSLNDCKSENDYFIYNSLIAKSASLIRERIKAPIAPDSFTMLVNDGVTAPAAAIDICVATYNKSKEFVSNSKVMSTRENNGKRMFTLDAVSNFLKPIPFPVLVALNLPEDTTVRDLIDYMNTLDDFTTNEKFDVNGIDFKLGEYIDKLEYVQKILDGEVTINHFGDGVITDEISSMGRTFEILKTCMYAYCGPDANLQECLEFINKFESERIVDVDSIVSICDNSYYGSIKDFVNQRARRANKGNWLYCTAVYHEISNAPISEQRDYAMEVVTVPSYKDPYALDLRARATAVVLDGDMSNIPEDLHEYIKEEASFIACNMFFHVLAGHIGDKYRLENGDYSVALSTGVENTKIKVTIPSALYKDITEYDVYSHRKIVSLDAYCQAERLEYGESFNYLIVNVDVTPWRVIPKKGYKVTKYNYFVNYIANSAIARNSEAFQLKLKEQNAKRDVIRDIGNSGFLIPYEEVEGFIDMPNPEDETIGTINRYLDLRCLEHIHMYMRRWDLFKADARSKGKVLKSMRLRSDSVYCNFADFYDETPLTENVIVPEGEIPLNGFLVNSEPKVETNISVKAIGVKNECKISKFKWIDYAYSESSRWDKLIRNEFVPTVVYCILGVMFLPIGADKNSCVNLRYLNRVKLEELANKGICYQLSSTKFLFKGLNDSCIVEVLND